ncbi:hypothetical protein QF012_005576 [Pseudomonas laurylsulfatiphila]|jgi:hypothetical protein
MFIEVEFQACANPVGAGLPAMTAAQLASM